MPPPYGVSDLRIKHCWICQEEEVDDSPRGRDDGRWVHPCRCSLVAHEECLLLWIKSKQPGESIACPQCAETYEVRTEAPPLLPAFRAVDGLFGRIAPLGLVAGLGLGGGAVSALYGAAAARAFLGPQVAGQLLDRPGGWSLSTWANLSLIPWTLLLARTSLLPTSLPLVLPFPLLLPAQALTWPPSPPITLAFLPVLRALYLPLKRRFSALVLGSSSSAGAAHTREGGPERHVLMIGDGMQVEVDVVGAAGIGGGAGAQAEGVEQLPQRRRKLTLRQVCKWLFGALSFPFLSRALSDLLIHIPALHPLLAYHPTPTLSLSSPPLLPWLSALPAFSFTEGPWWGREPPADAVWVRTTVAGALIVVASDACKLAMRWMEGVEERTRKVRGRDFEGVELGEEVLKEGGT